MGGRQPLNGNPTRQRTKESKKKRKSEVIDHTAGLTLIIPDHDQFYTNMFLHFTITVIKHYFTFSFLQYVSRVTAERLSIEIIF